MTKNKGKSTVSEETTEAGVTGTVSGGDMEAKPVLHTFVDGSGRAVDLVDDPDGTKVEYRVTQTTVIDNGKAYEFKHYVAR